MEPDRERVQHIAEQLTERFVDEGRLIEAGWVALKSIAVHDDASPQQVAEMRMMFFAGAMHLFTSICAILRRKDEEPTAQDLARMQMVKRELDTFLAGFKTKYGLE